MIIKLTKFSHKEIDFSNLYAFPMDVYISDSFQSYITIQLFTSLKNAENKQLPKTKFKININKQLVQDIIFKKQVKSEQISSIEDCAFMAYLDNNSFSYEIQNAEIAIIDKKPMSFIEKIKIKIIDYLLNKLLGK
jgi:hypothetical protein